MISLDGSIQRKFFFPADPKTTLVYFSDLNRIIYYLPHITVVEEYSDSQLRIRYQTVELGAYTINIYCDLACKVDPDKLEILIVPLEGKKPVDSDSTLNATTAQGFYRSLAKLSDEKGGTAILFDLQFGAKLQRPRGLRMMPKRVVDRIALSISEGRLEEMAEGFMANALAAFPDWSAEQSGNGSGGKTKRRSRVPMDSC